MSNEKYFYFSDGSTKFGPLSAQDIWRLMEKNRVGLLDKIYDTRIKKWTTIMGHEDFSEQQIVDADNVTDSVANFSSGDAEGPVGLATHEIRPASESSEGASAPAPAASARRGTSKPGEKKKDVWFVQREQHIHGPFSFLQIAILLKEEKLQYSDQLRLNESQWGRVDDFFSVEEVDSYGLQLIRQNSMVQQKIKDTRRKDVRRDISDTLYIYDGQLQYVVQGLDVSAQAIAFLSNAPHFAVGQDLSCSFFNTQNQMVTLHGDILRQDNLLNEEINTYFYRFILKFKYEVNDDILKSFHS